MELLSALLAGIAVPSIQVFAFLYLFPFVRSVVPVTAVALLSLAIGVYRFASAGMPMSGAPFLLDLSAGVLQGALLGVPLVIAFETLPQSLRLWDIARGAQFAEQVNPIDGARGSVLESIAPVVVLAAVCSSGLHLPVLALISFQATGPMHFAEGGIASVSESILRLSAESLAVGCLAALPMFLLAAAIDLGGGMLCRMAPRVSLLQDQAGTKLVLGVALLGILIPVLDGPFLELFLDVLSQLRTGPV